MMSRAGSTQEKKAPARAIATTTAALYVCVQQGKQMTSLAAERAETEGRAYARAHGLAISEVIKDPYGEPAPSRRVGWTRIRELVESGTIGVVITRWPAAIAPDAFHEARHREVRWLQDHRVQVHYSWAPLAATRGEAV
ncbi:hypothetical protein AB0F03_37445 [Streptomyces sp. NPDC028722]|uniref:hypothetical protein n=1 Tax=Streptomyces sp. NPDC028722 TaxID=3155016 RepID=UPI0033C17FA1